METPRTADQRKMDATRWGGVLCGVGSAINLIFLSTHIWAIWIAGAAVLVCGIALVMTGFVKRALRRHS